ncbi:hypothetical protein J7J90_00415 [Candidatus Micrarchaeota archaeon]|nr:hypothetical protein [Candidatus Micrarchaeota archaeon]
MKHYIIMMVLIFFIMSITSVHATDTCDDGTEMYHCSETHPGKYCTGDSSGNPVLQDYAKHCPCPEGYQMVVDSTSQMGRCELIGENNENNQGDNEGTQNNDNANENQANDSSTGTETNVGNSGSNESNEGNEVNNSISNSNPNSNTNNNANKGNANQNQYEKPFTFKPLTVEENSACPIFIIFIGLLTIIAMAAVV